MKITNKIFVHVRTKKNMFINRKYFVINKLNFY